MSQEHSVSWNSDKKRGYFTRRSMYRQVMFYARGMLLQNAVQVECKIPI